MTKSLNLDHNLVLSTPINTSMLTIKPITRDEYINDLMLFNHSLFIRPEWIDSICEGNKRPLYLNIYENGSLIGKIAGVVRRLVFFSQDVYFYSEPALKVYNQEALDTCLKALMAYAKENRLVRVTFNYLDQQSLLIPGDELGF